MLRAFHGLQTTAKGVLTRIPSDFQWYSTWTLMGISILKESQGLKSHSIRQKFVNLKHFFVINVKKSLSLFYTKTV